MTAIGVPLEKQSTFGAFDAKPERGRIAAGGGLTGAARVSTPDTGRENRRPERNITTAAATTSRIFLFLLGPGEIDRAGDFGEFRSGTADALLLFVSFFFSSFLSSSFFLGGSAGQAHFLWARGRDPGRGNGRSRGGFCQQELETGRGCYLRGGANNLRGRRRRSGVALAAG